MESWCHAILASVGLAARGGGLGLGKGVLLDSIRLSSSPPELPGM